MPRSASPSPARRRMGPTLAVGGRPAAVLQPQAGTPAPTFRDSRTTGTRGTARGATPSGVGAAP
eukprot:10891867-Alexandrium_andersonii.AAC.1